MKQSHSFLTYYFLILQPASTPLFDMQPQNTVLATHLTFYRLRLVAGCCKNQRNANAQSPRIQTIQCTNQNRKQIHSARMMKRGKRCRSFMNGFWFSNPPSIVAIGNRYSLGLFVIIYFFSFFLLVLLGWKICLRSTDNH